MGFLQQLKDGVFSQLITNFSSALPRVIFALILLLVGRFLAKTVRNVVKRVLEAVQIDRLSAQLNDIDVVQNAGMQIKFSAIVAQVIYYVILLFFILLATDMMGIEAITIMVRDFINYLPALLSAFVFLILGLFLADILRGVVLTALQSLGLPSAKMISTGVFYFLFITIAISALAQAKIQTGFLASNMSIIIGAGALAFAVGYGLASRDLISNYLAGYYNRNKIRIGDDVRILGVRGKVVMLDATSLILQTDEKAIIIPLGKLTTEKVEVFYPDPEDLARIERGK